MHAEDCNSGNVSFTYRVHGVRYHQDETFLNYDHYSVRMSIADELPASCKHGLFETPSQNIDFRIEQEKKKCLTSFASDLLTQMLNI